MKKKILAVAIALTAMGSLAACGSRDTSEMKYLTDFEAKDFVNLGEYKDVEVDLEEPSVTDEYLEGYIDYVLENSASLKEVTGRTVESGDVVNIDYEGKLDGVAFEGGTAKGYDLEIGSGSFIDGFEDGVIGMEIGETRDIDLSFPDPYKNNPDLSGKPVVFTVTVNRIAVKEVPELTDEYVAGLGLEGCSTADDYRNYMYEILMEQAQESFASEKVNAALEKVEAGTTFKEVPEGMLNRMNETLTGNMEAYAGLYGMEIGEYVAYAYGGSAEDCQSVILEQAKLMAQRYIMLSAIAAQEGIEVTDEELEESIAAETAGYAGYGYESEEAYRETIDEEAYREYLLVQKVTQFLGENVVLSGADE